MQRSPFLGTEFTNHGLVIETPRVSDIPRLTALTTRFALGVGTLRGLPSHETTWRTLMAAEDVVCAKTADGRMAGYYAANQFGLVCEPEELDQIRAARNVLCNRFRLPEKNVSFGAQVVIDSSWQHSDLRRQLLRALLRTVGFRYRCLFSTVKKDNLHEMEELPREGWRCFHEEDETCYMMLEVAKALRQLASSLVLRVPIRADGTFNRATRV